MTYKVRLRSQKHAHSEMQYAEWSMYHALCTMASQRENNAEDEISISI